MLLKWHIIPLLYCCGTCLAASSSTAATTAISRGRDDSTCPSRTANYLTHTLPQQCLTSPRAASSSPTAEVTNAQADNTSAHQASTKESDALPSKSIQIDQPHGTQSSVVANTSEPLKTIVTVTATEVPNQDLGPAIPNIVEEESPLESGNFLSFEEWKKQNLAKVGQSQHVGRDAANADSKEGRKRQVNVQNTLDVLGDDAEIDLDFSGFVPGMATGAQLAIERSADADKSQGSEGGLQEPKPKVVSNRKKDAGTTCKERFNYASFDCAANMLKTNPQAKSPGSVLNENKDAYMLNECSANDKFVILELCQDILVDTVVLANFEFFSSIFRTFRVSVSDRYPVKVDKWKTLGTFEARNTREVQAFLVENPLIWARYLRIEFLTHYGTEYYCPVSLIRVHGTTMLEEYKHDMDAVTEDDEDESDTLTTTAAEEQKHVSETTSQDAIAQEQLQKTQDVISDTTVKAKAEAETGADVEPSAEAHMAVDDKMIDSCQLVDLPNHLSWGSQSAVFYNSSFQMCLQDEAPEDVSTQKSMMASHGTSTLGTSVRPTQSSSSHSVINHSTGSDSTTQPMKVGSTTEDAHNVGSASSRSGSSSGTTQSHTSTSIAASANSTSSDRVKTQAASSSSEKTRQASSATQPPPSSPTTQESFFKSVQKRLQMLESNSSLSLQYIEEQSRALRDAFRKVEQRQLAKTTIFLDQLNSTVLKELREFRQQYDQLWQSTVIELEIQREQYQRENQAMHARLGILADELIFQKRMSILQMTLILVCLGLVLFSRGAINNYLELPLVQSVLSRSPRSRWMSLSGDSPSKPHILSRARSAHEIGLKPNSILKGHRRLRSDDSNMSDSIGPSGEIFAPPTPVSFDGFSDASQSMHDDDGKHSSDPGFDPLSIERPSTSPPVLTIPTSATVAAEMTPSTSTSLPSDDPTTPRLFINPRFASLDSQMSTPASSAENLISASSFSSESSTSDTKTRLTTTAASPATPKHLKWDLPDM